MPGENEVVRLPSAEGAPIPPPPPPPPPAPSGMSGSINVSVTAGGNTYTLAVGIPTSSGGAYTFSLTESGQQNPLADFKFKDENNFLVEVAMPSIGSSGSGVSVEAGFTLKEGDPGTT